MKIVQLGFGFRQNRRNNRIIAKESGQRISFFYEQFFLPHRLGLAFPDKYRRKLLGTQHNRQQAVFPDIASKHLGNIVCRNNIE